jgi:cytochrome c
MISALVFPVPRDLMLPLPLPEMLLKILLVVFFLAHILFINLVVGGSLWTLIFEWLGLKHPRYDRLAKEIAATITVNKSLAVVLGVGPLLCISLVYTHAFYTANVLTAHAWWSLVPTITVAFLLTYLHKYTWDTWIGPKKKRHVALGLVCALFFLLIPFVFLSNINLMLFPEHWTEVKGFLSSLKIGNVFPRYFHFFAASNAATGLFLVAWLGRRSFPVERKLPDFTRPEIKRIFYTLVFGFTAMQFVFGPVLFFTLPTRALTVGVWILVWTGAVLALGLLHMLYKEMRSPDAVIGKWFWPITGLFSVIVLLMGTGRHLYREAAVYPLMEKMMRRTEEFRALERGVQMRLAAGLTAGGDRSGPPTGRSVFFQNCASCHVPGTKRVGPPLEEIHSIYKGNPAAIVTWAKAPGKKRAGYQQMPTMAHVPESELKLAADYLLEVGAGKTTFSEEEIPEKK